MENLCGSMSHISLGDTARHFQGESRPSQRVSGISTAYRPPPQMARDHSRFPMPTREPSAPMPREMRPRMSGSGHTFAAPTSYRQEPMLPVARDPRFRRGDSKKVKPSQLHKLCKAFDGSGDPYDHVARFRQVLYAEDVKDVHTMVQGFGLTLEGRALRWFQSLSNATLYDFEILVEAFIKENTKTGIKHNTLTLILDFK